jgi:hypothetical protein
MACSSQYQYLISMCSLNPWKQPPHPSELYAWFPSPQWQDWPCFVFNSNTQISSRVVYVSYCPQIYPPPPSWCVIKLLSRFGRLIARVSNPQTLGLQTYLVTPPVQRHVCIHPSFLLAAVNSPSICLHVSLSYVIKLSSTVKFTVKMDSCFPKVLWVWNAKVLSSNLYLVVRGSGCVEAFNYDIELRTFCSGVYGQNVGTGERAVTRKSGTLW